MPLNKVGGPGDLALEMDVVTATEVTGASVSPQPTPNGHSDPAMARFGAIVPVLGAHAQAGASGVALALADAAALAGLRVLLVDGADPGRSGLAGVCQVEGPSMSVGDTRAAIRIAARQLGRAAVDVRRLVGVGAPLTVAAVPKPPEWAASLAAPVDLTVVDVGWDPWRLMTGGSEIGPLAWCLAAPAATRPMLVVRPTVPSVGLAEAVIARYSLGQRRVHLAPVAGLVVTGADSWPNQVRAGLGYLLQQAAERAHFIPSDSEATVVGWTANPLPVATTTAAAGLLRVLGGRFAEAAGPPPPRRGRLLRRS